MAISREDVLRVAALAHLEFSEAEVETMRSQLDSILNYIGKLNELDTAGIEPMTQALLAGEANASLRDDDLRPDAIARQVLEQAPDAAPPYFRVPRVIDR